MLSRSRRTTLVGIVLAVATVMAIPSVAVGEQRTRALQDALDEAEGDEGPPRIDPEARAPHASDRYGLAGGCFVLRSGTTGAYVARQGDGFAATAVDAADAEPFHLQAFDLGKYLLFGRQEAFVSADRGASADATETVFDTAEGYVRGTGDETLQPARDRVLTGTQAARGATIAAEEARRGDTVVAAAGPSAAAEWLVTGSDGTFSLYLPVDDGSEDDPGPLDPELSATLVAGPDGVLRLGEAPEPGSVEGDRPDGADAATFTFEAADGCATWPEIDINVTSPEGHPAADTPFEESRGYVDGHLHMMAFEFLGGRVRCGRPWHPYGVTHSLVDCPDHEPGGRGAVLEAFLSGGDPVEGHDTTGWPSFGYWPRPESLTHEQVYYRWLERAWRGGLRMFTNLLVDNGVLCEVYPYKENSCNEMDGVRLQAQRLRELERYIDAQYGGPGEGWFRIVDDPFEARRVINSGRLAVVMGIEVSVLFDCGEYLEVPRCDQDDIDRELDAVYELGVRQLELVNKFDNALSGVAGDTGETGLVVNQGNRYETGHYWKMDTCPHVDGHVHGAHDKTQPNWHDQSGSPDEFTGRDALAGGVLAVSGTSGVAPVYPEGPHCNTIGLTDLGEYLLGRMMDTGLVFDPDHMSAVARAEALDVLEAAGYSGVISSHSWADDPSYQRIWRMGGVVTPMAKNSWDFVEKWRTQKGWADDRFLFGLGYGADTNGFASQGNPRDPAATGAPAMEYPFEGFGGVRVEEQTSGEKTYDINDHGVAHYGLYPDWIEDLRVLAESQTGDGEDLLEDMARGAEAYLQMWERGIGVPPDACREDVPDLTAQDVDALEAGSSPEQVLVALGQPASRQDRTFTYCVDGSTASVRFDEDGRLIAVDEGDGDGGRPGNRPTEPPGRPEDPGPGAGRGNGGGQGVAAAGHDHAPHDHGSHDHGPLEMVSAVTGGSGPLILLGLGLAGALFATRLTRRTTRG